MAPLLQHYSLSVYLVKQLTSVTLLQKLRAKGIRNPDHSRALSKCQGGPWGRVGVPVLVGQSRGGSWCPLGSSWCPLGGSWYPWGTTGWCERTGAPGARPCPAPLPFEPPFSERGGCEAHGFPSSLSQALSPAAPRSPAVFRTRLPPREEHGSGAGVRTESMGQGLVKSMGQGPVSVPRALPAVNPAILANEGHGAS